MYPVFIYTLNDPTTGIVRYCGQTVDPDTRLSQHISNADKNKYHSACWIQSLLSKRLRPVMEILDVVPDDEADFWECEYIQNFRERGFDLTNITPGGEKGPDMTGIKRSPEFCAKQSARLLGKKLPLETCAKISATLTGKKRSEASKRKQKETWALTNPTSGEKHYAFGKKLPPERCAQISAAMTGEKNPFFGKNHPPEIMAIIIAKNTGKPPNSGSFKTGLIPWNTGKKQSPAHIAKNSTAHLGQIPWNKGMKNGKRD